MLRLLGMVPTEHTVSAGRLSRQRRQTAMGAGRKAHLARRQRHANSPGMSRPLPPLVPLRLCLAGSRTPRLPNRASRPILDLGQYFPCKMLVGGARWVVVVRRQHMAAWSRRCMPTCPHLGPPCRRKWAVQPGQVKRPSMVGRALVLSVSEQVTGSVSALLLLWALAWHEMCWAVGCHVIFCAVVVMGACCLSQPLLPDTLHPALWPWLTRRPPEAQHRGAPGVASNSRG